MALSSTGLRNTITFGQTGARKQSAGESWQDLDKKEGRADPPQKESGVGSRLAFAFIQSCPPNDSKTL